MPLYAEAIGPTEEAKSFKYIQQFDFPIRLCICVDEWSKEYLGYLNDGTPVYAKDFIFKKKEPCTK